MIESKQYYELWMHREMLRDRVRCEAYKAAISKAVTGGNTVLDVGTGTGILAMFAVQAGAKKVYAVERTSVSDIAQQVIESNRMQDHIQVIQDNIENVHLPEKVDVIIAEWMGGFGVDENLLAPVLLARDRWLKDGGCMVPRKVTAMIAPVWDQNIHNSMTFWHSRSYGVDLSLIAERTANELHNAMHHILNSELLADPQVMWETDVYSDSEEEAHRPFSAELEFTTSRSGKFCALAAWFTAELADGITLSNAPDAPKTHWGRTVMPLAEVSDITAGTRLRVKFVCTPVAENLCRNEWSVQVEDGPWLYHSGRQGCTASPGFH